MITLYVLFAFSLFCPIYTYALYPIVLRMRKRKEFKKAEIAPSVSVLIIGDNSEIKHRNTLQCDYSDFDVMETKSIEEGVSKARGEIILITDTKTELDLSAISNIVQPFADERVGCVVGQQLNPNGNSAFWKYENKVKELESRIGCVSGANESIFAVRKSDMPIVGEKVLNKPFYIATKITENGRAVVFQPTAKTYEREFNKNNFLKHVQDATGYWQALRLFPKMLLPRNGSFVYISHRVVKCFVWLDMLVILITSGIMMFDSVCMAMVFVAQLIGYLGALLLGKQNIGGVIGRLMGIGYDFVMLNVSYFIGLFS